MVSRIAGSSDARGEDIFSNLACKRSGATYSMIPKSGNRFSEKIMLKQKARP
jgi:hypothetical protein